MRDDLAVAERFRREAGWWRLAPFITVLILLLITVVWGGAFNGIPNKTSGAIAEAQDRPAPQVDRR